MANPGYPMQPMQPMQPMPPMPPPGQPPMMRRGTSKAVPVVVSAGLAIGVFCGLSFGLGFEDESEASTTTASASSTESKQTESDVPEPFQPKPNEVKAPPTKPAEGSATDAKPAEGSAVKPAEGSAAANPAEGSAAKPAEGSGATVPPATPVKLVAKLTVVVKPEAAAKVAKVYIDGKAIEGNAFELDLTSLLDKAKNEARKSVTVRVKAAGYKEQDRKVELVASGKDDVTNTAEFELEKRPAGTGLPRPPNPGGGGNKPKPKCKKPPCGLIDI